MTLQQFIERYPSTVSDEQIAMLNRRTLDESIAGGTLLKRVSGGACPRPHSGPILARILSLLKAS